MSNHKQRKQLRARRKKEKRRSKRRADNADAINTRLERLRSIVYDGPTRHAWAQMCDLLNAWPDDGSLSMGLDYAEAHTSDWPDALKRSTGTAYAWLLKHLDGLSEPRIKLLRMVHLTYEHSTQERFETLLSGELSKQLTGVVLSTELKPLIALLREIRHLRHLGLSGCAVDDDALLELLEYNALPHLESLDLSHNTLTWQTLKALLRELPTRNLKDLYIGYNPIRDGELMMLADTPLLKQLNTLSIAGQPATGLTPDMLTALLSNLDTLKTLDLSQCALGDIGAETLSALEFPALRELHLHSNAIGLRGAKAIARMALPNLRVLDLNNNHIGHLGLTILAEARDNTPALQTLLLNQNGLDPDIGKAILQKERPDLKRGAISRGALIHENDIADCLTYGNLSPRIRAVFLSKLWLMSPETLRQTLPNLAREIVDPTKPHVPEMNALVSAHAHKLRVPELKECLRTLKVRGYSNLRKETLVKLLKQSINALNPEDSSL